MSAGKPKQQQQHVAINKKRPTKNGQVAATETVAAKTAVVDAGDNGDSCKNPLQAKPNSNRREAGANWNSRDKLVIDSSSPSAIATSTAVSSDSQTTNNEENKAPTLTKSMRHRQKRKEAQRNKFVAMDCEMVGVGQNGQDDMLARVSIVNKVGEVLLDKFVKPREEVTDYRTSISGIRPHNIEHGDEFTEVQDEVIDILQGKILIGHAIRNDLAVLQIKHPYVNIRDTSRYKPLCRLVSNGHTPSLKRLTQAILGLEIQTGEHNSIEDARAAMSIYNRISYDWEQYLLKHNQYHHHHHHHKHGK